MTKGVVDVFVSNELDTNHIVLVVNYADGLPNDLDHIASGSAVTVMRGDKTNDVTVIHEKTTECPFSYMEVDSYTADKLKLRDGDRYALESDLRDIRIIKMKLLTSSEAYGFVKTDQNATGDDSVVIGYMLQCRLGIPDNDSSVITVRRGTVSKRLNVIIPDNALDTDIRLQRADLRKFSLHPEKKALLRYDRVTQTLDVTQGKPAAAAKKSSRPVRTARRTYVSRNDARSADWLHKQRELRTNYPFSHARTARRLHKQREPRASYPFYNPAQTQLLKCFTKPKAGRRP